MLQHSKSLAAILLIAALIVGGVIGFSASRIVDSRLPGFPIGCPPQHGQHAYWDRITKDWQVTPAQKQVIDSLLKVQRQKMMALYGPVVHQTDSVSQVAHALIDSTQSQIRALLTPEQQTKFDALHREAVRRDSARRACRPQWGDGPGHEGPNGPGGPPMPHP